MQLAQDRHLCGLFSRETWLRLLAEVGFEPICLPDLRNEGLEAGTNLFLGRRQRG